MGVNAVIVANRLPWRHLAGSTALVADDRGCEAPRRQAGLMAAALAEIGIYATNQWNSKQNVMFGPQ
jgi:hypothetical protein